MNSATTFRQSVVTHLAQKIAHRDAEGQWHTASRAATWGRVPYTL